jgi:hypothetical protein
MRSKRILKCNHSGNQVSRTDNTLCRKIVPSLDLYTVYTHLMAVLIC